MGDEIGEKKLGGMARHAGRRARRALDC